MDKFCVSVFMLTYNQEEFISQAIEGVLMQQTDFPFQLVIGEDCSTDKTRQICEKYASIHPEKIKLLLNEQNIGIGANYVKTYKECTGKYVAICDGDDYWIDPKKLQKQVDVLKFNEKFKIVYSNKYNLFPSGKMIGPKGGNKLIEMKFEDLVIRNFIPSVTVLFEKKNLTSDMEKWIPSFPYADWPTYLLILSNGGSIYFLEDITAVYRKDFGTSTFLRKERSKIPRINKEILENIYKDKEFQVKKNEIKKSIYFYKTLLMGGYVKEGKIFNSLQILIELTFKFRSLKYARLYLYSIKRSFLG